MLTRAQSSGVNTAIAIFIMCSLSIHAQYDQTQAQALSNSDENLPWPETCGKKCGMTRAVRPGTPHKTNLICLLYLVAA